MFTSTAGNEGGKGGESDTGTKNIRYSAYFLGKNLHS